jgi:hypothetical protein
VVRGQHLVELRLDLLALALEPRPDHGRRRGREPGSIFGGGVPSGRYS